MAKAGGLSGQRCTAVAWQVADWSGPSKSTEPQIAPIGKLQIRQTRADAFSVAGSLRQSLWPTSLLSGMESCATHKLEERKHFNEAAMCVFGVALKAQGEAGTQLCDEMVTVSPHCF